MRPQVVGHNMLDAPKCIVKIAMPSATRENRLRDFLLSGFDMSHLDPWLSHDSCVTDSGAIIARSSFLMLSR